MSGLFDLFTRVTTALQLLGLLASTALMAVAVRRHRQQVLYAEGVTYFAGSLVLLTLAAVVDHGVPAPDADAVATALQYGVHLLYTGSAVGIALGTWHFARDFVTFPDDAGDDLRIEGVGADHRDGEGFDRER
mgnify:CR=1 FL=1